ncbi:MAG: hypothetical protein QM784_24090 [Polyangiaceae bacterium]
MTVGFLVVDVAGTVVVACVVTPWPLANTSLPSVTGGVLVPKSRSREGTLAFGF